ncbi:MAG: hypothetical protein ACOVSI_07770 [Gemmatimonas sp.]|jgi:hypothetical protein
MRSASLRVACTIAFAGLAPVTAAAQARDTVSSAVHREPVALRYRALAIGVVSAATWVQAFDIPEGWDRTWQGYGNRLSDQVGFALTEELLREGLSRATGWESAFGPCDAARGARPWHGRARAATRCAVHSTFVAHNRAGASRPNAPLLGAIVAASALSLTWRPERASASKGQRFMVARVGIVTGATVVSRAVREMRRR